MPSSAVNTATTSTTPGASAPSRIQAGFLLVKLDDSINSDSSLKPLTLGATTLEGAVIAQQATGAPLVLACSHFIHWATLEAALAVANAHWKSPDADAAPTRKRVIVAGMHGGASQSIQGQMVLLNKGVVLCFDCFGRVEWLPGPDYYPSDEETAVRIAELVRQGFAGRILVSSGVSRRIHLSRCEVKIREGESNKQQAVLALCVR